VVIDNLGVIVGEADETWPRIVADAARGQLKEVYTPVDAFGQERKPSLQDYPAIPWQTLDLNQFNRIPGFVRPLMRHYKAEWETFHIIPIESGRGCPYGCEFCTVTGFFGDSIETIAEFDPLTGKKTQGLEFVKVYANSHYVTPRPTLLQSIKGIKAELKQRLAELNAAGRLLEAQRLEQRTMFDLEMMEATGSCAGIENYSRYLTGRLPGEPPLQKKAHGDRHHDQQPRNQWRHGSHCAQDDQPGEDHSCS
jgi:hypothetical protein